MEIFQLFATIGAAAWDMRDINLVAGGLVYGLAGMTILCLYMQLLHIREMRKYNYTNPFDGVLILACVFVPFIAACIF